MTYDKAIAQMKKENKNVPSKTAFQQFCRYEKEMTYQAISNLTETGKREVWNRCNGERSIRSWSDRTDYEISLCEYLFKILSNE